MKRATSHNMDVNEVLGGDFGGPPLELNMVCPKILSKSFGKQRNNWNIEQCDLRVRLSSPCTFDCSIGQMIRERYENNGRAYLEDQEGTLKDNKLNEEIRRIKRISKTHKWGKPTHLKRNIIIVTEVLNGTDPKIVASLSNLTPTHIRNKTRHYCKMANPKLFYEYLGKTNFMISYLILKKDEFIKYFPKI